MKFNSKKYTSFLIKLRKESGLSQGELAARLGYSTQIVSNWERGLSFPNMSCWQILFDLFDIDINGLIYCKRVNRLKEYKFVEESFTKNIKQLRTRKNLTQIDLANALGVNNKTISSWENGQSLPTLEYFILLKETLGVSFASLYYATDFSNVSGYEEYNPNKLSKKSIILIAVTSFVALSAIGTASGVAIYNTNNKNNIVIVNNSPVVGIKLTSITKTDYRIGEEFDKSSIVVTTVHEDESEIVTDSYMISGDDFSSEGEKTITITYSEDTSLKTSFTVTVHDIPLDVDYLIKLNQNELELYTGESFQFEATKFPFNYEISYSTSNSVVATIDESGLLKAKEPGTVLLTAFFTVDNTKYDTCFIKVKYRHSDVDSPIPTNYISDEGARDFFYGDENEATYTYYFEDKKSVLYEDHLQKGLPYQFNFFEPTIGVIYGHKYKFLGWDINGDSVVDEIPSIVSSDLNLYAVYSKEQTTDPDTFTIVDKTDTTSFYGGVLSQDYELNTLIYPSYQYLYRLDENCIYHPEMNIEHTWNMDGYQYLESEKLKHLIFLEGVSGSEKQFKNCPNLEYVRFSSDFSSNFSFNQFAPQSNKLRVNNSFMNQRMTHAFNNHPSPYIDRMSIELSMFGGMYFTENKYVKYLDFTPTTTSIQIDGRAFYKCESLRYLRLPLVSYSISVECFNSCDLSFVDFSNCSNLHQDEEIPFSSKQKEVTLVVNSVVADALYYNPSYLSSDSSYNILLLEGVNEDIATELDSRLNISIYKYSETKNGNSWRYNSLGFIDINYNEE